MDTTAQNDSFRTLEWLADTISRAIPNRKSGDLLNLFPAYGTYLEYSRKQAPDLSNGTRSMRYIAFKSGLAKKHKKLKKNMKNEGLGFAKAEVQKIKLDTATNEDSISYAKISVYYLRNKSRFTITCNGIKIANQWFVLDGFPLYNRKED